MKQFYLAEIVTQDKLVHQGLFYQQKKAGKKAILWVHGLTSTFHSNTTLLELTVSVCEASGVGFAVFNNRGHDIVTGIKEIDQSNPRGYAKVNGGAGYERFEDCIFDIDAGISFLINQGYEEVILVGHSTGSNKVCYYNGNTIDSRVVGVILLSPVSDRLDPTLDKEKIDRQIAEMRERVEDGRGDELLSGVHIFPVTPRRFLSLYSPNSPEDTFDYGYINPKLTCFSAIKVPLLVLFGSKDENLDRRVNKVLDVFAKHTESKNYQSVIIPDAFHSYNGKEQEVVQEIFRWVKGI